MDFACFQTDEDGYLAVLTSQGVSLVSPNGDWMQPFVLITRPDQWE